MTRQLTSKDQDYLRLVKSDAHIGSAIVNKSMERYISHRNDKNIPIFNLEHTYNKIKIAARIIAGLKNIEDAMVIFRFYRIILSAKAGDSWIFAKFVGCFIQRLWSESRH